MVLAQVVNVLVLFGERRRRQIDWTAVRPAVLAALPGLPIGALLLRTLPESSLRLAVGLIVCAVVANRLLRRLARHTPGPSVKKWRPAEAGPSRPGSPSAS